MRSQRIQLPYRKRSYRFVLTPMADAMFQLLIFFMLANSLTPYSLITFRSAAEAVSETAGSALPGTVTEGGNSTAARAPRYTDITIWTLREGTVSVGGQTYDTARITDLAQAIGQNGNPGRVVVIVGETARMQDVATALEALRSANVASVQITNQGI